LKDSNLVGAYQGTELIHMAPQWSSASYVYFLQLKPSNKLNKTTFQKTKTKKKKEKKLNKTK
jgi:hypothetical protein